MGLRLVLAVAGFLAGHPSDRYLAAASFGGADHVDRRPRPAELRFELRHNLIVVKGKIATFESANVILDTGTNSTAISKRLAGQLGLRGNLEALDSLSGTTQVESAILPQLEVGPMSAEHIKVIVTDLSLLEQKLQMPLGGIVGMDVLSASSFTVDFRKRTIVFGIFGVKKKTANLEKQMPFLIVKAYIDGREVRLIVDSGTSGVMLFGRRPRVQPFQVFPKRSITLFTPTGSTGGSSFRASRITLGRVNLGSQTVAVVDAMGEAPEDVDGLLGLKDIGFRRVYVDLENSQIGWD
jgi:hypothetical protein